MSCEQCSTPPSKHAEISRRLDVLGSIASNLAPPIGYAAEVGQGEVEVPPDVDRARRGAVLAVYKAIEMIARSTPSEFDLA